jgi:hypothetical protein
MARKGSRKLPKPLMRKAHQVWRVEKDVSKSMYK